MIVEWCGFAGGVSLLWRWVLSAAPQRLRGRGAGSATEPRRPRRAVCAQAGVFVGVEYNVAAAMTAVHNRGSLGALSPDNRLLLSVDGA